jgi:hypothetical protein
MLWEVFPEKLGQFPVNQTIPASTRWCRLLTQNLLEMFTVMADLKTPFATLAIGASLTEVFKLLNITVYHSTTVLLKSHTGELHHSLETFPDALATNLHNCELRCLSRSSAVLRRTFLQGVLPRQ